MRWRNLLVRSTGSFAVSAVGIGAAYVVTAILARLLGVEQFGIYLLGMSVVLVAALVTRLGVDQAAVRLIAISQDRAGSDERERSSVAPVAALLALSTGFVGAIAVVLLRTLIADVFGVDELSSVLVALCLAIPGLSLLRVVAGVLKGLGRPLASSAAMYLASPLTLVLLLLVFRPESAHGAAVATTLAAWLAVGMAAVAWAMYRIPFRPSLAPVRGLVAAGSPLVVYGSIILALGWIDTWMLAYFRGASDVGLYRTASRTSGMFSVVLVVVGTVVVPVLARAYHARDGSAFRLTYARGARLIWIASTPILAVMVLFPNELLSLFFGSEFAAAGASLRILAIGQFVYASFGPAMDALVMCGREKRVRDIGAIALIANILLNLLLVPRHGLIGAAWATALSFAFIGGIGRLEVRRIIRKTTTR